MKEKFLFCYDWFNTYRNNRSSSYDTIIGKIFNGSLMSCKFYMFATTCSNAETTWERYQKLSSAAEIKRFINKMYPIVKEFTLPQE